MNYRKFRFKDQNVAAVYLQYSLIEYCKRNFKEYTVSFLENGQVDITTPEDIPVTLYPYPKSLVD